MRKQFFLIYIMLVIILIIQIYIMFQISDLHSEITNSFNYISEKIDFVTSWVMTNTE